MSSDAGNTCTPVTRNLVVCQKKGQQYPKVGDSGAKFWLVPNLCDSKVDKTLSGKLESDKSPLNKIGAENPV